MKKLLIIKGIFNDEFTGYENKESSIRMLIDTDDCECTPWKRCGNCKLIARGTLIDVPEDYVYGERSRIPVATKYPKVTRENLEKYLLEYQLEMIGKHLVDTLDDDKWYFNMTMTTKQREDFRKHAIKTIQRILKCNRGKAYDIFDHFVGNLGLRIKN